MVFYEVPGSREVFAGEVSTHSWKYLLYVFLWDFASGKSRLIQMNTKKAGVQKEQESKGGVLKTNKNKIDID